MGLWFFLVIAGLAQCYVGAIKSGGLPCIENAVETTAKTVNSEAIRATVQLYKDQMHQCVALPIETQQQLSEANLRCRCEATALFLNKVVFDKDRKCHLELTVEYRHTPVCNYIVLSTLNLKAPNNPKQLLFSSS